ncbi:MAG: hypothetical protein ACNS63_12580 [Candidatus Nitrospinota bacterium M3_3B_026]
MIWILNFLGFLSCGGALLAFAMGYAASGGLMGRGAHMAAGLVSALVVILWLSTAMFYFIGTGSAAKDAARRGLLDFELYSMTKAFKKSLFPPLMLVIALFIVMPVLGAAYDARKAPLWFHTAFAWASIAACPAISLRMRRLLRENAPIFAKTVEAVNAAVDERKESRG